VGGGAGVLAGSGGQSGAAGGDGGALLDSGLPDAEVDAGAQGCSTRSYLICEDFESAPLAGIPEGWQRRGDAVAVSDQAAHAGSRSLRLGPITAGERRIARDASSLGRAHWGRVYFKVQLPVPDAFVHSTLVALHGDGPTRGASEYRVVDTVKQAKDTPNVGSRIQFLWNVQPQSSGEFGDGTSYDFPFDDQWHCAEWHLDAASQSYAFYYDGEELITIDNGAGNYDGTDMPDSFDELRVGWNNYQQAPPGFTAYLDDFAIDEQRIGCD
jgi:hypothetical protein